MENKQTILSYINDFRRHMSKYLKKGIGLSSKVYPSKGDGCVIELKIGPNLQSDDEIVESYQSINEVLKNIPQRFVSGNIDAITFSGTNISMEPDKIIIIKGENGKSFWDDSGAFNDVNSIMSNMKRGEKK